MTAQAKYFHDRIVLLLLSINIFLALTASIFVLLKLSSSHGSAYIVQCRDCSNVADINRFTNGSVVQLLSFVGFVLLVAVVHFGLSLRCYRISRQVSIIILALGVLLLLLGIIVSNALLVLR